jgi:hypothetical protein
MKFIYCFDREKPFANAYPDGAPDGLIARYSEALASELVSRYPGHDILVRPVTGAPGDVMFEPELAMPDATRLETAVRILRVAHRLAERMEAAELAGAGRARAE